MLGGALDRLEGMLHDLDEAQGRLIPRSDLAGGGVLVPELPRIEVHQRLDVDGGDIEITCVLLMQGCHRIGECLVQFGRVAHVQYTGVHAVPRFLAVSSGEGIDEILLHLGAVALPGHRLLDGVMSGAQSRCPVVIR